MKEQLQVLLQLQQLEQQKQTVLHQKALVDPGEVRRIWQEIRLLTQRIAEAETHLAELKKACGRQEAEIAAAASQCQLLEARLYGGEITNLKELEQLKNSCDALRQEIAGCENEELANLEQCEQLSLAIADDEALLKEKKRLHAGKQQLLGRDLADCEKKMAQIELKCLELAGRVEPELLSKFRAIGRKIPLPVAKVENGVCVGCRISIPVSQAALQGEALVYCDNCGRFLLPG